MISFRELYEIHNAIIENNLEMTFPRTSLKIYNSKHNSKGVFLSHSPILSTIGNAIDFKNKNVVFLFAMLKRKSDGNELTRFNKLNYLNNRNIEFFVTSVPFKNIRKFVYRDEDYSGIFIIGQGGRVIPVLSTDVGLHWVGVGRENIVKHYTNYDWWYKLLRKLASPENLKKAEEKTLEWLKNKDFV